MAKIAQNSRHSVNTWLEALGKRLKAICVVEFGDGNIIMDLKDNKGLEGTFQILNRGDIKTLRSLGEFLNR